MTDNTEKLAEIMSRMGVKPEDLAEHPDDRFEEELDEWERMMELMRNRGWSSAAPVAATQLMLSIRLGEIEMALMRFSDNLLYFLENQKPSEPPDDERA